MEKNLTMICVILLSYVVMVFILLFYSLALGSGNR